MPWETPAASAGPRGAPTQRTSQPIVTGTSVLGLKFRGGVMLAADTLASYGTLAMFKDVERIHKVSETTLVGAGGEFSDFQQIQHIIGDLTIGDTVFPI
jgi:20S proteasome subunit beta 7